MKKQTARETAQHLPVIRAYNIHALGEQAKAGIWILNIFTLTSEYSS